MWQETYSSEHPEYKNLYDFVGRAVLKVLSRVGISATWLFYRGFDGGDLQGIGINWVVRQMGGRNVAIGDDRTILVCGRFGRWT